MNPLEWTHGPIYQLNDSLVMNVNWLNGTVAVRLALSSVEPTVELDLLTDCCADEVLYTLITPFEWGKPRCRACDNDNPLFSGLPIEVDDYVAVPLKDWVDPLRDFLALVLGRVSGDPYRALLAAGELVDEFPSVVRSLVDRLPNGVGVQPW